MSAISNTEGQRLFPSTPADLNPGILSYLDGDPAAISWLTVNKAWREDPSVQEIFNQALANKIAANRAFEARFPADYVTAFANAGKPIYRLPYYDLTNDTSFTPPIQGPDSILRGEFNQNLPFIQVRIEGRPTSQAQYQAHPALPLPPIVARNVRGYLIIFQRYTNGGFSFEMDSNLEKAITVRHRTLAGHNMVEHCNQCPFDGATINPTVLQDLLSDQDPDFRVPQ